MDNNDLNRRLRYALMIDDADVLELYALVGFAASVDEVEAWRIKPGEPGHLACPPDALHQLLNALIIQRRGALQDAAPSTDTVVEQSFIDNNTVLKQLRIALFLKASDVYELIQRGGGSLGKSEVNALFRGAAARNYRRCGDQVLRWFLAGLASTREQ